MLQDKESYFDVIALTLEFHLVWTLKILAVDVILIAYRMVLLAGCIHETRCIQDCLASELGDGIYICKINDWAHEWEPD